MEERFELSDPKINRDLLRFVTVTPLWFWGAFIVLGGMVTIMFIAIGYMIYEGLYVTGLNRPTMWAVYITNFVYWVGISHSGVMMSSILRLTQAEWRRPITRAAEVLTVLSLMIAALFPLIHTGRPWRTLYWVFPYDFARGIWPDVRSPLVWDPAAIFTYLIASSLSVYVSLIPDLAIAATHFTGWRYWLFKILSLGFRGNARQWRIHAIGSIALSALILTVFVTVHSIVSWDFGMALVPSWHATALAPYFVLGAMHSGVGLVVIAMAGLRKLFNLQDYFTLDHFDAIGRMMVAIGCFWFYFFMLDLFFGLFSQDSQDIEVWQLRLFTWPYNLVMVIFFLAAFFIPVPLWLSRKVRRNPALMFWTAISVNIGMWLERFMIIVPGLQQKQPFTFVWDTYVPSIVEMTITIGSFALVAFGFLLFCKFFPIVSIFGEIEGQIVKDAIDIGQRKVPAIMRDVRQSHE